MGSPGSVKVPDFVVEPMRDSGCGLVVSWQEFRILMLSPTLAVTSKDKTIWRLRDELIGHVASVVPWAAAVEQKMKDLDGQLRGLKLTEERAEAAEAQLDSLQKEVSAVRFGAVKRERGTVWCGYEYKTRRREQRVQRNLRLTMEQKGRKQNLHLLSTSIASTLPPQKGQAPEACCLPSSVSSSSQTYNVVTHMMNIYVSVCDGMMDLMVWLFGTER
ncbi:hypothetical protein POM88_009640 [Heracleum sosnowskyi]|uniref:Uncharacterized protein n=1 Tax=Heracleum sosnowskyi TaxID=360622 RepID=A0AAD8JC99_9APIA|nr:hypothetical protein POM88_009640 [Heracleum sosnowskyi]